MTPEQVQRMRNLLPKLQQIRPELVSLLEPLLNAYQPESGTFDFPSITPPNVWLSQIEKQLTISKKLKAEIGEQEEILRLLSIKEEKAVAVDAANAAAAEDASNAATAVRRDQTFDVTDPMLPVVSASLSNISNISSLALISVRMKIERHIL